MPPDQSPTLPTTNEAPSLIGSAGTPASAPAEAPAGTGAPVDATGTTPDAGATGGTGGTGDSGDSKPDANAVTKDNPFKPEEVKFSDGTSVDPELSTDFVSVVNEFGIPRDVAAKFLNLHQKAMLANSEAGSRDWAKMQEEWTGEVMKDPELGGNNWLKVQSKIGGLLDQFGTPELRQAFDLTGAGNNPHVVRFMSKVANVLSESGFISSNSSTQGERSAAEILYPNQGKK